MIKNLKWKSSLAVPARNILIKMLKTQNFKSVNPTPPTSNQHHHPARPITSQILSKNKLITFVKYIYKGWDTAVFITTSPASQSTHLVRVPQVIISVLREPVPVCFGVQEGFTKILKKLLQSIGNGRICIYMSVCIFTS